MTGGCLSENTLAAYAHGELEPGLISVAEGHLYACESCRGLLHSNDPASEPSARRTVVLAPGTRLGRFIVGRFLGSGAMGVVYAAVDTRLDREVALKLLRPSRAARATVEQRTTRLVREAQAMARLSHPNLVTIFDVDEIEGQLCLAMELVRGRTLRAWLAEAPRKPADILAVVIQAGRGLAAAHAAGVIHRDFKPENILVSDAGRVCVTDFGLARFDADTPELSSDAGVHSPPSGLTETGTLLGTPAYMAPEQFERELIDARTDQFAFCVVLFEALYGKRPFDGDTATQLAASTRAAMTWPSDRVVPAAQRTVLARGLSRDRAARFGSLTELLDNLERRRTWTTPMSFALVAGAVLTGVTVFAANLSARDEPAGAIVPPGARYGNYTYAEWLARFFQFTLEQPAARDPFNGSAACGTNQRDDVWFLSPPSGEGKLVTTLECTVPRDVALFVNVISVFCDTWKAPNLLGGTDFPVTKQGLDECVAHTATATTAALEIDGVPVVNLETFRVRSTRFSFAIEDGVVTNLGHPPGVYGGLGEGISVLVRPLPVGEHVLHWHVTEGDSYMRDMTYRITVVP
ncbi:MAG: serine/threonine-protein kinase [Kofleriaceae bacterium]